MQKKLNLDSFSGNILKADVAKNILGGYGNEGTSSSTANCTNGSTWVGSFPIHYGDTTTDGDFYSSC